MADIDTFVIVTGSMRSGTSLLGYLLQQRPGGIRAVADLAFENDESSEVAELFGEIRAAVTPEVGFGDPFRNVTLSGALLDAFTPQPGATAEDAKQHIKKRLEQEIMRHAPAGPDPRILGIKRTSMNYEIDVIKGLYNDVRLVFTVRDPRDVFVSHARRLNNRQNKGTSLLILAYVLGNHYMLERLAQEGSPVLVVKYEDLATTPIEPMRQVLNHIGINEQDFQLNSLASHTVPNNSSYGEGGGREFVQGDGITQSSIGRFQSVIDPEIARLIEVLCAPLMKTHGYALQAETLAWEEGFERHIDAMRARCVSAKISFEPVERRLVELGIR